MIFQLLLVFLLSTFGLFFVYMGVYKWISSKKEERWRPVNIDISRAKIDIASEVGRYGLLRYYFPVVTYQYDVNDKLYESTVVCNDRKSIWFEDKVSAEKLLDSIRERSIAFYNPGDPSESVIIPGLSKKRKIHYLIMIVTGFFLILASMFFYVYTV